nr:Fructose-bisphosphate aldolase class-II [uncultured bacterium]
MLSLKKALSQAKKDKVAIAHFNISEFVTFKAIWQACQELSQTAGKKIPVIIGVSEGEQEFLGTPEIALLIKGMRKQFDYPIFLNADHHKSLESCKKAIDAGFDAVIIDAADKSYAENVALTRSVVEYARASKNKKVLIEGEIGFIGAGSEVKDRLPDGVAITEDTITKAEEAAKFVEETGVDMLAPAIGNVHGMFGSPFVKGSTAQPEGISSPYVKHLFIKRVGEIRRAAKVPLVLHGGSGTPDEDFVKAIEAGVRIVHISTELRRAWRAGIERGLKDHPAEVAPYKLLESSLSDIKAVVMQRLKLFNKL